MTKSKRLPLTAKDAALSFQHMFAMLGGDHHAYRFSRT